MSCVDSAIIKALVEHVGMDPDGVPLGTPITGKEPITVSEDKKVSIAIDYDTMSITDGKLAVDSRITVNPGYKQLSYAYTSIGDKFEIANVTGPLYPGDILVIPKGRYIIASCLNDNYTVVNCSSGATETLTKVSEGIYQIECPYDYPSSKYGIFTQRTLSSTPVPVMPAQDLLVLLLNLVQRVEALENNKTT